MAVLVGIHDGAVAPAADRGPRVGCLVLGIMARGLRASGWWRGAWPVFDEGEPMMRGSRPPLARAGMTEA